MNPGLVVKLRPTGPWRIGPDSGARNRVDVIYHSDSLYSAITSAMARLGSMDEWLDATARNSVPAVCFGSCFPFLEEIGFVVPPRTIWPPKSSAVTSPRVRWKSARFVPLGIVQAILAGQTLDENHWAVDGVSGCLAPVGRPGPFITSVRWSAAVDRLTGATERHSTACIEFRAGSGLWTVVSFRDQAAHERWAKPVKAAFRLLADTGFGGERSRGWGRTEAPEFVEGVLPDMILGPGAEAKGPGASESGTRGQEPGAGEEPREQVFAPDSSAVREPATDEPEAWAGGQGPGAGEEPREQVLVADSVADQEPSAGDAALGAGEEAHAEVLAPPSVAALEPASETQPISGPPQEEPPITEPPGEPSPENLPEPQPIPEPEPPAPEPEMPGPERAADSSPAPGPQPPVPDSEASGPRSAPGPQPQAAASAHWLLSLFTPAQADSVDWARGNYTLLARGGRVDSPAGSGELKKQLSMVAEGSVVFASPAPCGAAPDVAPDGFAHPVFRAGFALSIPLPEGS